MPTGRGRQIRRELLGDVRPEPRELIHRSLLSGIAVFIPLVVTLVVLGFALNFLSQALNPVVALVQGGTAGEVNPVVIRVVAVFSLLALVIMVGFFAEFGPGGGRLAEQFDDVMAAIPGIGSVYTSFDEMSELLLDSDTDSFQEVKLVEYPKEGYYTVAFKTADGSAAIAEATGNERMETLFMPMAPNPVMGGFVVHVPADRVLDVNMTVEEGLRSIVTSGVTVGETGANHDGLGEREMRELGQMPHVGPGPEMSRFAPRQTDPTDRRDRYDEAVDPEHAETPARMAARERAEESEATGANTRPEAVPGDGVIGEETDGRPAADAERSVDTRDRTEEPPAEVDQSGDET